jgi:hypothetical protein
MCYASPAMLRGRCGESYQRSATSDQEARGKQIPRLRDPTRQTASRKRNRVAPLGMTKRESGKERRADIPDVTGERRQTHEPV